MRISFNKLTLRVQAIFLEQVDVDKPIEEVQQNCNVLALKMVKKGRRSKKTTSVSKKGSSSVWQKSFED